MKDKDQQIDDELIAKRAYEIAHGPDARESDEENWLQAERELRAAQAQAPKRRRTNRSIGAEAEEPAASSLP